MCIYPYDSVPDVDTTGDRVATVTLQMVEVDARKLIIDGVVAIAAWAEDDFRSVNGQIEYLLTECVKQRKKNGGYVSTELDKSFELDFLNEEIEEGGK